MRKCDKCGNPLRETTKQEHQGMGRYKQVPSGEYECSYCIQKGDAGPGLLLKALLNNGASKDFVKKRAKVSTEYARYCESNPDATQDARKAEFQRIYDELIDVPIKE